MDEGRLIIYAIALLIVSVALVLGAARFVIARRQRGYDVIDDEDVPLNDIALLFRPRAVTPVYQPPEPGFQPPAPEPQPAAATFRAPEPVFQASDPAQTVRSAGQKAAMEAAPVVAAPAAKAPKREKAEVASPPPTEDDGRMELLPGRLEPVNHDTHQEIRFVRVPGVTRFTFGRSPGPAYEHVQLRAATASRMHGYMVFENSRWRIGNLSETNAVIVNGAPLTESDRQLEDGDQIEFGEVAFVFRER